MLCIIIMQRVLNQSVIQPSVVNVKCFIIMNCMMSIILMSIISVSSYAECRSTECCWAECFGTKWGSINGGVAWVCWMGRWLKGNPNLDRSGEREKNWELPGSIFTTRLKINLRWNIYFFSDEHFSKILFVCRVT